MASAGWLSCTNAASNEEVKGPDADSVATVAAPLLKSFQLPNWIAVLHPF